MVNLVDAWHVAEEIVRNTPELSKGAAHDIIPTNIAELVKGVMLETQYLNGSAENDDSRFDHLYPYLEEEANRLAVPMVNRLTYLRKTLLPMVNRIRDSFAEGFSVIEYPQPDIQQVTIPSLFRSNIFMGIIQRFTDKQLGSYGPLSIKGGFSPLEEEQIAGFLETGDQSVNDAVLEMVADNHPKGWIEEVYKKYFVTHSEVRLDSYSTEIPIGIIEELSIVTLICASMVARQYASDADTSHPDEYRAKLVDNLKSFAARTGALLSKTLDNLQRGLIVFGKDNATGIHLVYEDNYKSYIEQGGDVDVLHYAIVSGTPTYISTLIANHDTILKQGRDHYNDYIRDRNNRYGVYILDNFTNVVGKELRELTQAELIPMANPDKHDLSSEVTEMDIIEITNRAKSFMMNELRDERFTLSDVLLRIFLADMLNIKSLYDLYTAIDKNAISTDPEGFRSAAMTEVMGEIIHAITGAAFSDTYRL